MNKVAILGSGKVGKAIAYNLLKSAIPSLSVTLYNHIYEPAQAAVKDMAPISCTSTNNYPKIQASNDLSDIDGADIVVVCIGKKPSENIMETARREGWDREAQSLETVPIILEMIPQILQYAPHAILAVVTNQVDTIVNLIAQETEYLRDNIVGISGMVDNARFAYSLREILKNKNITVEKITSQIYGYHNNDMFFAKRDVFIDNTTIYNDPVYCAFATQALDETRVYGQRISQLQKMHCPEYIARLSGSYLLASEVTAQFCCSYLCENLMLNSTFSIPVDDAHRKRFGLYNTAIGMPLRIGKRQINRLYDIDFNKQEYVHLQDSVERFSRGYDSLLRRINA